MLLIHRKKITVVLAGLVFLSTGAFAQSPPEAPGGFCVDGTPQCNEADTPTAAPPSQPSPSSPSGKRWRPGHYMLLSPFESGWAKRCDEIGGEPNVRGIMIRALWSDLESARGVYNWSALDQAVNRCATFGKLVFVFVLERSFGGASSSDRCRAPSYVKGLAGGSGCMASKNGGLPSLHKPEVMDRYIALTRAIAARYDDNPGFGGMQSPESSTGFAQVGPPADWSREGYVEQLIRLYRAGAASMQKGVYIAGVNSFAGMEQQMITGAQEAGASLGGPDTYPASCTQVGRTRAQSAYVGGFRNKMATMFQIQPPELNGKVGYCSVQEIVDEGQQIGYSHYFWTRIGSNPGGIEWKKDILPAIRNGLPARASCPPNFPNGCDS